MVSDTGSLCRVYDVYLQGLEFRADFDNLNPNASRTPSNFVLRAERCLNTIVYNITI